MSTRRVRSSRGVGASRLAPQGHRCVHRCRACASASSARPFIRPHGSRSKSISFLNLLVAGSCSEDCQTITFNRLSLIFDTTSLTTMPMFRGIAVIALAVFVGLASAQDPVALQAEVVGTALNGKNSCMYHLENSSCFVTTSIVSMAHPRARQIATMIPMRCLTILRMSAALAHAYR